MRANSSLSSTGSMRMSSAPSARACAATAAASSGVAITAGSERVRGSVLIWVSSAMPSSTQASIRTRSAAPSASAAIASPWLMATVQLTAPTAQARTDELERLARPLHDDETSGWRHELGFVLIGHELTAKVVKIP